MSQIKLIRFDEGQLLRFMVALVSRNTMGDKDRLLTVEEEMKADYNNRC